MKYISFIRGINVNGKNPVKMSDLVVHYEDLGFNNIRTYIQSGNVIFELEPKEIFRLENEIQKMFLQAFGYEVRVFVLTRESLQRIYQNNPFIQAGASNLDKLHLTLLSGIPASENIIKLPELKESEDQYEMIENAIYIYCENGYGRTKLNNNFFERKLKLSATTRNWTTIESLVKLM
jgi:uncharacterized protein (DUF1697 family)